MDALWIIQSTFWYKIGKKSARKLPNNFDVFSILSILFTKKWEKKCLNIKMWKKVDKKNT